MTKFYLFKLHWFDEEVDDDTYGIIPANSYTDAMTTINTRFENIDSIELHELFDDIYIEIRKEIYDKVKKYDLDYFWDDIVEEADTSNDSEEEEDDEDKYPAEVSVVSDGKVQATGHDLTPSYVDTWIHKNS